MIPKHYPKEKLVGKTAILEENIRNHGGEGLTKGSLVTIKGVVRGRGLTIQAETCPVCGQYAYITGVDRSCLTLLDEFIIDPENPERDESFMEKFVTNIVGKLCRAAYDVGDLMEKKSVTTRWKFIWKTATGLKMNGSNLVFQKIHQSALLILRMRFPVWN